MPGETSNMFANNSCLIVLGLERPGLVNMSNDQSQPGSPALTGPNHETKCGQIHLNASQSQ